MKFHNTLGPGFQERIYQRALAIEMSLQGINFIREYENCVFYKTEIVGKRRSDFLVEGENVTIKTSASSGLSVASGHQRHHAYQRYQWYQRYQRYQWYQWSARLEKSPSRCKSLSINEITAQTNPQNSPSTPPSDTNPLPADKLH